MFSNCSGSLRNFCQERPHHRRNYFTRFARHGDEDPQAMDLKLDERAIGLLNSILWYTILKYTEQVLFGGHCF